MFHIGDVVRIKTEEEFAGEFGEDWHGKVSAGWDSEGMDPFLGTTHTVTDDGCFCLLSDIGGFVFSDDMLVVGDSQDEEHFVLGDLSELLE